jgi:hypothetical protein
MSSQVNGPKVLIFQLVGGGHDGQTMRSDSAEDAHNAKTLWSVTWNGTVGRRFDVPVPHETAQRYQVLRKLETTDEIRVVCQYVGGG